MPTPRPARRIASAAAVAVLALTSLAACGDDEETASTTTAAPAEPDLQLSGAWARTSPAMTTAGAVYLQIANDGTADDALIGVSVDPAVAGKAEIHETVPADEADMGGESTTTMMGDDNGNGNDGSSTTMGDSPMMEMVPVDEIAIPAGETVLLEPGGYHIMLLELAAPLELGSTIEVTLTFEQSGEQVITAEVRDTAP